MKKILTLTFFFALAASVFGSVTPVSDVGSKVSKTEHFIKVDVISDYQLTATEDVYASFTPYLISTPCGSLMQAVDVKSLLNDKIINDKLKISANKQTNLLTQDKYPVKPGWYSSISNPYILNSKATCQSLFESSLYLDRIKQCRWDSNKIELTV